MGNGKKLSYKFLLMIMALFLGSVLFLNRIIFPNSIFAAVIGDINSDGKVDIIDIGLVIDNYGKQVCGNIADISKDCKVDIVDIGIIIDNYGSTTQATPSPTGGLTSPIWGADADSNGMNAWKSIQCPAGGATIVDDPEGKYGKVFRTTLNPGETYSGDGKSRCELYGTVLPNGQYLKYYEGDEYFLGLRTRVSNGIYTNNGNSGNFIQLKGDSSCGGPAVGLTMENGSLTLRSELYGISWMGPKMTSFSGTWHDLVIHVYFSKNANTGFLEVWLDGVQQTFINGAKKYFMATMCPNDSYIYLKMGYYRGSNTQFPTGTHWFEFPRLGPTYNSVVPR